jgi:predicted AlkP superfamily pyrophosphatase or phosphodiesterase
MRLLVVFLLTLAAFATDPGPVVLLSFDGISAVHFTPTLMPRVHRLSAGGWRGKGVPPFPSTTFNGHATLATGCWPGHHGVVANAFVDPVRGYLSYTGTAEQLQREPLWVATTRSGIRTAVYHWVGGTGPWEGVVPWRMEPFVPDVEDQDALAFVDRALGDGARLVMAYLSGIDGEGHTGGSTSAKVRLKLAATDALLGPWLERLLATWPGARVVLVADHGMATMRKRINLHGLLEGLPVTVVAHGGSAYVYLKEPGPVSEVVRRARKAGLKAWAREDLPAELHLEKNPRVGDVVVLAPMGTWLAQSRNPEARKAEKAGRAGAHGYLGSSPEMHTWLVVLGAGVGNLGEVQLWDIAPTLATWLGARWASPPDGRPLAALSTAERTPGARQASMSATPQRIRMRLSATPRASTSASWVPGSRLTRSALRASPSL